jgi:hypothetical protein
MPTWPPLDRRRPKGKWPPRQLKRSQSQVKRPQSQVKRPQSRMTLPKTTPRVKRKMQKFFATGVIFHKLWTVHRLRRRRTGPIRQLCETRKGDPPKGPIAKANSNPGSGRESAFRPVRNVKGEIQTNISSIHGREKVLFGRCGM